MDLSNWFFEVSELARLEKMTFSWPSLNGLFSIFILLTFLQPSTLLIFHCLLSHISFFLDFGASLSFPFGSLTAPSTSPWLAPPPNWALPVSPRPLLIAITYKSITGLLLFFLWTLLCLWMNSLITANSSIISTSINHNFQPIPNLFSFHSIKNLCLTHI